VPDPDLTPSEEQLRRLLADARHDEPVPDDVVDRLDRVLADLRDEPRRTPAAVDAAPIDLAARRRRRIARNVLVAAAAVVVLGVGISRIDLSGQDAGGSADSGSASAPESAARDDESRPLVLSSEDFDRQVRRLGLNPPLASLGDVPEEAPSDRDLGELAARGWCHDPAWGGGDGGDDIVRVRYDGERGVLVLREPVGGTRVVDLYLCGDSDPTRSTTVPVG
jgi:hypothetical protein